MISTRKLHRHLIGWLIVCAAAPVAQALETDLAPAPLITSSPQTVLPNVMYVLDDSGSMAWTHMPDTARNFLNKYGYVSSQCNGVYYNPNITYKPPVTVSTTGVITSYPNASFSSAWKNGYSTGSGTVDLSTSFYAWDSNSSWGGTPDTAQPAYYYKYSGTQTSNAQKDYYHSNSTFYTECASSFGSAPGNGVFTKVLVNSTSGPGSTDERTNFANWFSYYRIRMLMMKTASGLAFQTVDDKYRVGYMSINNNGGHAFLNINTFSATQKHDWYAKLYAATPNNSTPLREALSNAGRIYAGVQTSLNDETVVDPIQYSCQKNFTLLSTDGYWNGSTTYNLSGNPVGNQDSDQPRPFNDGGTVQGLYQATIDFSGSSGNGTSVTSIKVGGKEILSAATTSKTDPALVATYVSSAISNCTTRIRGNCTISGYRSVQSGSTVTITAPTAVGVVTGAPVVLQSGPMIITAGAFVVTGTTPVSGTSDTLADVAEYYYRTDLRTDPNSPLSLNNVIPGAGDDATWQHMTTFTLGLGVRGRMIYTPAYKVDTNPATNADYLAVKNGSTASSTVCTWQTSGTTCNWPIPGSDYVENVDDLWHAAVNGRGTYLSATDPASLSAGLINALQGITAMTSDAAAATTSNPNVTAGDNFIFMSSFRSADWYGDFERRTIDIHTAVESATPDWSARALLDANSSRTIYTFDPGAATSHLKSFTWANLTPAEQGYFSLAYISAGSSPALSQFCASGNVCLSATDQAAAAGAPLVNFIRGDRTNEGDASMPTKYFRLRTSVLGDIVDSEAAYVRVPMLSYADAGYAAYKTAQATRQGMVYVGANDGMLHAFNADTGQEAWAYIPSFVMPTLYRLADKYYATRHQFYVDGSPTATDVYFGGAWHTILVGGLNSGGKGYYALDVTDPASPKALWEFTDTNMGYTFGRPEITKLQDGTWVVLVTSGYNNDGAGQDGQGRLYIINAGTGQLIRSISTGVGSTGAVAGICATGPCPSGLAQIRAWVDSPAYDNTTTMVYGGDLFGNVWRFDVNNNVGSAAVPYEAQVLATLRGPSGNIQSITTRPELGKVAGFHVVFVGTGRYLGVTDLSDASPQSIYAIKDALGSTSYGNPRLDSAFIQQTLTDGICPAGLTICSAGTAIRTSSNNPVNFSADHGWYVDLPATRERANTDPQLALGTLSVTTNVLDPSACSVGGKSFINYFDYRTGGAVQIAGSTGTNNIASISLGDALATRTVQVEVIDQSGNRVQHSLIRKSDNTLDTPFAPTSKSPAGTRRTSWRELVTQ